MGKNQHVVHSPKGGWNVKGAGNSRATVHTATKAKATRIARTIAKNQKSELVIHNMNGRIAGKDSHGRDPFPPKG